MTLYETEYVNIIICYHDNKHIVLPFGIIMVVVSIINKCKQGNLLLLETKHPRQRHTQERQMLIV